MSGHSKWSTIKRQKGANDAKRGQLFTKLANAISVVVREGGGDPASNIKLRLAVEAARMANMPKDNIQRAIDRGIGTTGGAAMETVTYEGYGPAKVALLIEAATDNRNRTLPVIRAVVEKSGGTFVSAGSVSWMFVDVGLIAVSKDGESFDRIFELAVDAEAHDVEDAGDVVQVYTNPTEVEKVKNFLIEKGLSVQNMEIFKKPSTTVEIKDRETASKVMNLVEKLEELVDVQKVYANFDIPDDLLL